MRSALKIAIIGDYNVEFHTHSAINRALSGIEEWSDTALNFYWINSKEISTFKNDDFKTFNCFWIGPGPFQFDYNIQQAALRIMEYDLPLLITDLSFRLFIKGICELNDANFNGISDNNFKGDSFTELKINPLTSETNDLYKNRPLIEFTINEYHLDSRTINFLSELGWNVIAQDQHENPILLKHSKNCYLMSFCPQITSTRELPHPVVKDWIASSEKLIASSSQ
jgi:CTP synthase (UTP-ammonia lyase)